MARPTWATREGPILEEIYQRFEDGARRVSQNELTSVDLDEQTMSRTLQRLHDGGYIDARFAIGSGGALLGATIKDITPYGLQAVGAWPTESAIGDILLQQIAIIISQTSDPEEVTRLERFKAAASDVSKATLSGVVTAVVKSAAGLP